MRGVIAGAIRIWLADKEGPQTRDAITEGIGLPGDVIAYRVIGRMKRDGHLVTEGDGYVLGKPAPTGKYASEEECKEAKRVRDRERKRLARERAGAKPSPNLRKETRDAKVNNPKPLPGRVFEPATAERTKRDVSADIEEFVAKGGRIEILQGIQVKPLTYGGHRDQNRDSMRRSLHE